MHEKLAPPLWNFGFSWKRSWCVSHALSPPPTRRIKRMDSASDMARNQEDPAARPQLRGASRVRQRGPLLDGVNDHGFCSDLQAPDLAHHGIHFWPGQNGLPIFCGRSERFYWKPDHSVDG